MSRAGKGRSGWLRSGNISDCCIIFQVSYNLYEIDLWRSHRRNFVSASSDVLKSRRRGMVLRLRPNDMQMHMGGGRERKGSLWLLQPWQGGP